MPDDNQVDGNSLISDSGSYVKSSDKRAVDIKMPLWLKIFAFVGLICIGQFFVCSLIGLFRGYSVQSIWPTWIMLGGVFALLVPQFGMFSICSGKPAKYVWMSYLTSFCIIFSSVIGISQGKYQKQGDALFKQGKYLEAIGFYEKELSTWYLRLTYNYHESWSLRKIDESLFNIAQDYCKDGDFDKARQAYKQVVVPSDKERQKYRQVVAQNDKNEYLKFYLERSAAEVEELDRELANIAVMQEQLAGEVEDNNKANILFDLALAYRRIECNKKAKEQYDIIQTLDVHEGFIENAKKFSAGLDGS